MGLIIFLLKQIIKIIKQYVHNKKENNMKENKTKISDKIISYLNTNYKTSLPTEQKN